MSTQPMMTREEAALSLLQWLQERGAVLRLHDQFVFVDLNPIADMNAERAEFLAMNILDLQDELRAWLSSEGMHH